MIRQDFATAVNLLTKAQELSPHHRGIQKALGYSALWNGDMEKAVTLLSTKPEAEYELLDYIGWWPRHGKPELGTRASEALQILQDS